MISWAAVAAHIQVERRMPFAHRVVVDIVVVAHKVAAVVVRRVVVAHKAAGVVHKAVGVVHKAAGAGLDRYT